MSGFEMRNYIRKWGESLRHMRTILGLRRGQFRVGGGEGACCSAPLAFEPGPLGNSPPVPCSVNDVGACKAVRRVSALHSHRNCRLFSLSLFILACVVDPYISGFSLFLFLFWSPSHPHFLIHLHLLDRLLGPLLLLELSSLLPAINRHRESGPKQ